MASFLESELSNLDYHNAKVVVLPCPYERTTSYLTGTAAGPEAILAASNQLELYDSELALEPALQGIYTLDLLAFAYQDYAADLELIYQSALAQIKQEKWLISLGGEHTITWPLVRAFTQKYSKNLGVVHLDAHFDLRDSYEGTKYSHACVLRRIVEMGVPTLSLGVRAFCKEEADFAKENKIAHSTDLALFKGEYDLIAQLAKLPENIYLTIDLDFFVPAEVPGVGTPVPGGLHWWSGLEIIRQIFKQKNVVGADIVELCPAQDEGVRSAFLAAQLAYKCMGYKIGGK